MGTSTLSVAIAGRLAGRVDQRADGSLSFSYDAGYSGPPLSLSMPVSNRSYGDKAVRPYLMGLLPDGADARRTLGRALGVSGNNPFALLSLIGLDCPGAVQLCAEESLLGAIGGEGSLRPVTDAEIAGRLAVGRSSTSARWTTDREHWSLGGQQSKFALRREGGSWFSCEGAAATTHILKPGIPDLAHEALNEFICAKLAAACGIPAAGVEYVMFEGEPAIVVARYDRVRDGSGKVVRLHQEDLCQSLGVPPENKYPEEGGPGANDVLKVLRRTGAPAASNSERFVRMLFFNYLIAAPDAHAKNYSLLLDRDAAYLAPLYDVASKLPYTDRPFDAKTAMGIAGENRVGRLSARRLSRFAEANGLDEMGLGGKRLAEMLKELAEAIPPRLEGVLVDCGRIPGVDALGERMLSKAVDLCERSLARLEG